MTEEVQPVEEVAVEEVAQPEQTLEAETIDTETNEETPEPSAEIDEETTQKEEARKHFQERQSRREREEQLQRENEYLRQQLAPQAKQSQQPVQQNVDPNEPDLDVFLENGHTAQQFFKAHRAWEREAEQRASAENEIVSSYSQQMEAYEKNVPDVKAYAREAERILIPAVQDAILRSSKAPEIIEKIALDPKYANELNNSRDVFDLSRKIAQFEMSQPKVKAPVSSAPRGPSTPKSEPVISAHDDLSNKTSAEYAAIRNAQRKNRR